MVTDTVPRPSFELTVSQTIDPQSISNELSDYFSITRGRVKFVRAATGSGIPPFVQIVAEVAAWLPLAVFASAFLKRIAEKTADEVWSFLKKSLSSSNKHEQAFASLISALVESSAKMDNHGAVIVGLNFPSSDWGTVVIMRTTDPVALAKLTAKFVVNVEKIGETIRSAVNQGTKPLGYVHVIIGNNDSITLSWIDSDFKTIKRELA